MVFIASVLLMVSTLAVHGKIVSTDGPVILLGYEGNTFSNIKPADYPQEEIDYFLESNPAHLKRLQREADSGQSDEDCIKETENLMMELASPNGECGNCETDITCERPYRAKTNDNFPHVIVQSKYFQQTIRQVMCSKPTTPCFRDYVRDRNKTTQCKQIKAETHLYVWDREAKNITTIPGLIYVDCVCVYT